jgi:hypothetical protein
LPSRFFAEGFSGCPFSKHLVGPVFVFAGFSDSASKHSLLKPIVLLPAHDSVSSIAPQAQMKVVLFRRSSILRRRQSVDFSFDGRELDLWEWAMQRAQGLRDG